MRAAETLFRTSGFRAVSMEAVARDGAVSKATLYSYFKNKDELYIAVCARMARLGVRTFDEALAAGPDVDSRVVDAVVAQQRLSLELALSSPHAEDLFTRKAQLAGDLFEAADQRILQRLTAVLKEDTALRPKAAQLARAIFYGSKGLAAEVHSVDELATELRAFISVHLRGARTAAASPDRRRRVDSSSP